MADPTPNTTETTNGDTTAQTNPSTTADETITSTSTDVEMKDSTDIPPPTETASTTAAHLTPQPPSAPTPTPAPIAASSTPTRNSPHPASSMPPVHAIPHGSPTRMYLNQNVTPHLLEAMKHLVTNEPEKPLKWLSEFLAQKSLEIEGP